jgi:hypothetical protein
MKMNTITDHGPKRGSIEVTRSSDNLRDPKVWVAEIQKHPGGRVEYAIQFVGRDEGKMAAWIETATVRTARKAIKAAVKSYIQTLTEAPHAI